MCDLALARPASTWKYGSAGFRASVSSLDKCVLLPATGQELLEALEPEEHKREFRVLTCLTFRTHRVFFFICHQR